MARPGLIKFGRGCPVCAKSGFNPEKSAWTYGFIRNGYLKYGITNDINRRLYEHQKHGDIEIVYKEYHPNGTDARKWENNIKKRHGGNFATREKCPDGWTETLSPDLVWVLAID